MKIDLHVHSKSSDGKLTVEEIIAEARLRQIHLLSITDHDSIVCQEIAQKLAKKESLFYFPGVELNVTFCDYRISEGKFISLDFLGYHFDVENRELKSKLHQTIRCTLTFLSQT